MDALTADNFYSEINNSITIFKRKERADVSAGFRDFTCLQILIYTFIAWNKKNKMIKTLKKYKNTIGSDLVSYVDRMDASAVSEISAIVSYGLENANDALNFYPEVLKSTDRAIKKCIKNKYIFKAWLFKKLLIVNDEAYDTVDQIQFLLDCFDVVLREKKKTLENVGGH